MMFFSGHGFNSVRRKAKKGFAVFVVITLGLLALPFHSNAAKDEIVIVAFGDSLTAGFLLPKKHSFPSQLEKALKKKGYNARVLNAGLSGDTTLGGLARLDWSVPQNADAVIIELGANDALRGLDPKLTKETLDQIIQKLKKSGQKILLTGMEAPRGYGDDYVKAFSRIFPSLAKKHDILLYPFFLKGVALKSKYNLPDGMHPNSEGVQLIVKNMMPIVEQLIEQVNAARTETSSGKG